MPEGFSALIVDDDEAQRDLLKEMMEQDGYRATTARGGEEALSLAAREAFDILVVDLRLQGMDGIELVQRVREIQPYVAAIVFSGHGSQDQVAKAFREGRVNHFLGKPFQADQLFQAASLSIREQQVKQKEDAFRRELEQRIREVTAELEEKNRILQEVSIRDNLTGLYNQRHFYHVLEQEVERARRQEHPLSLLLLDVDGFKNYNDTRGHQEGDEVLIGLGEVIRESIRRNVDSGFRYGGDEFTVVLPETTRKQAKSVAERIVWAFAERGQATLSIGLVDFKPIYDLRQFIKLADEAMYKAKHQGGNRVFAHIQRRSRDPEGSWGS